MKTTIDIKDDLLIRAKKLARKTGKPLRAIVEDSLRLTLSISQEAPAYELPERSFGNPEGDDPLELLTWQDLRSEIYGEPDSL